MLHKLPSKYVLDKWTKMENSRCHNKIMVIFNGLYSLQKINWYLLCALLRNEENMLCSVNSLISISVNYKAFYYDCMVFDIV